MNNNIDQLIADVNISIESEIDARRQDDQIFGTVIPTVTADETNTVNTKKAANLKTRLALKYVNLEIPGVNGEDFK